MSVSLVAVFIPLLLMGGIVGRLFREFAVTLSVAIGVSLVVSLTTTPMMCAHMLKDAESHGWLYRAERAGLQLESCRSMAGRSSRVLRHPAITLLVLLGTIGAECLPVHSRAQRIFPAAGQRTPDGLDSGRSGHVLSSHADGLVQQ